MSRRISENKHFLFLLYTTDTKQRKALLGSITKEQLMSFCELVLNIIKGVIPVSRETKNKLKRYARVLRLLAEKRSVSRGRKIALLLKHMRLVLMILRIGRKFFEE